MIVRRASRACYFALGWLAVALAVIGAILPGLPTTVFVLLASYCFSRCSPRIEQRLYASRWLGGGLRRYRETGGMTARAKVVSLLSMWTGIGVSAVALDGWGGPMVLVLAAGAVGTTVLLGVVATTPNAAVPAASAVSPQGTSTVMVRGTQD